MDFPQPRRKRDGAGRWLSMRTMEIIIPHINTDLDALGAAVGAQVLYPQAQIVLPGAVSPLVREFLSLHHYNLRVRTPREIDLKAVSRVVVVDTADPARLGSLQKLTECAEVHLFDHHPPEPHDLAATVEVRDLVGSTCTLLAELLEEAGAPLTPLQATAMLLGIYADTGSLALTGTTERDVRAAAFLLSRGASLRAMARFLQAALSPGQENLLNQLQSSSRWVSVSGARLRLAEGHTAEYVGGLALVVHRLQEILPAPCLIAAVTMADRVYLVARSDVPWIDVARLMEPFGGGGHASAASAVVKGSAAGEVLARLQQVMPGLVSQPPLARDLMSAPVKAILPDKPARAAERLMLRHGHSGLPVVDEQGRLQGIISLRDVEKARRHDLEHAPVKGMMIRSVVTVSPATPVDQVQELMVEKSIGRVLVVEDSNLVGIISRSDLLGLLYGGPAPRWHETLFAPSGRQPAAQEDDLVQTACARLPQAMQLMLKQAGAVAEQLALPVYAAGGFVRDLLLGKPNLDVDLVVEGDAMAFAGALAGVFGGQVKAVPRFKAAHIVLPRSAPGENLPQRIDVSTARREFYEHAAALPLVEHADLKEDLYRRDFSINAMAIRLGAGGPAGLLDFYGGLADLQAGVVRILHTFSFVEDPTRIVRGVRFASRYGFRLDPETSRQAVRAVAEGYFSQVSAERLRNELILVLQERDACDALARLAELGALDRLLPEVDWGPRVRSLLEQARELDRQAPDLAGAATMWVLRLMVLLHALPQPQGMKLVQRLKLHREAAESTLHALAGWRETLARLSATGWRPAQAAEWLGGYSPEGLLLLHLLGAATAVEQYWRNWRHLRLGITGLDLIARGIPPGPAVGRVLGLVLADRLNGLAPDRQTQLSLALGYANKED